MTNRGKKGAYIPNCTLHKAPFLLCVFKIESCTKAQELKFDYP